MKREPFDEIVDEDDVLLSKREVAAMIGCCPRTVMRRVHAGLLPPPIVINCQTLRWSRQTMRKYLRELREAVEEGG